MVFSNQYRKDSIIKSVSVASSDNCFSDFHAQCLDQPTVTLAGREYKTVKIGSQCWFAENVDFGIMVKYNETEQTDNATVEKYCYDDDPANCEKYGGIYTWYEMMDYKDTPGTIGICPVGWHIPTQADWDELANALGGYAGAGRKMMSCENDAWTIEDLATSESGFTAYPGGRFWVGDFDWIGWQTNFWTSEFSTLYNSEKAFYRGLSREKEELIGFGTGEGGEPWLWHKWWGAYVRCVKDN